MVENFVKLCKMSQKDLKKYAAKELGKTYDDVKNQDGFVFAKGTVPILLVAHLDTVHKELPENFVYDSETLTISSPQGIGGDDRCGVYMIFEIIKKHKCSVLFCEDEEIGMVGAEKFVKSKASNNLDFNYIIELDRKGNNDAVFYDCDNSEFEEFITKEFFKTAYGSFSDISTIAPALGCAAVNLSCGYYNAHTKNEYVSYPEMIAVIGEVCNLIERTTDEDKFEYIEREFVYNQFRFDSYGYGYGDIYFLIQYTDDNGMEDWFEAEASSEEEAIGMFCIKHPNLTFRHIVDIYQEGYDY